MWHCSYLGLWTGYNSLTNSVEAGRVAYEIVPVLDYIWSFIGKATHPKRVLGWARGHKPTNFAVKDWWWIPLTTSMGQTKPLQGPSTDHYGGSSKQDCFRFPSPLSFVCSNASVCLRCIFWGKLNKLSLNTCEYGKWLQSCPSQLPKLVDIWSIGRQRLLAHINLL